MSGKEAAAYHIYAPELSPVEPEISLPSPYPETEQFLQKFLPHAESLIVPALHDPYLHELVDTIHNRIQSGKTTYGDIEFFGLANQITGRIFEIAAHQTTQEKLHKMNPDLFVTSPAQSQKIYEIGGIKKLASTTWTQPDGFIFQKNEDNTLLIGACEYTGELNLGNEELIIYTSPHKQKQLEQHRSGKVIHDAFTRHTKATKKRIGRYISSLFPDEDLSPHLKFNKRDYFSVFALPNDDNTPPRINGHIIEVPLSSNDSYYTALSILHEIEYPAVFDEPHELPAPSTVPVIIDLSHYQKSNSDSSVAD